MITTLEIRNYALIEELVLQPHKKLNVVTGETGAGKSIMLGAIGLLLGKRADTKVLFDQEKKCMVEATFNIGDYALQDFFDTEELDYSSECIIRREISPSGKSRAFVNDTPVTLDVLKKLGPFLMDIHSQHETLDLGKNQYQLQILDFFAQHKDLVDTYKARFKKFQDLNSQLQKLREKAQQSAKELDYQQFILKELEEADLENADQTGLEEEVSTLENAEEIKERLRTVQYILDESESATLNQLQEISSQLSKISNVSSSIGKLHERLDSVTIELRDVLDELQSENDNIIHDPQRATEVRERLDTIYRLQTKHGEADVTGLLRLQAELSETLSDISGLEEEIANIEKQILVAENDLTKAAKQLSDSRKKAAKDLANKILEVIKTIGIENGSIDINIEEQAPTPLGFDRIEFLFSANKGMPLRPMKEVASGGEFSRLTFALKYLIADKTSLPTIIFDEIDTGVSGEIAIRMVRLMQKMADNHQILSISHLPQFAAGADHHYMVYKDHNSTKSVSRIQLLPDEDRIVNIAGMIGGTNASDTAKQSANELIEELGR